MTNLSDIFRPWLHALVSYAWEDWNVEVTESLQDTFREECGGSIEIWLDVRKWKLCAYPLQRQLCAMEQRFNSGEISPSSLTAAAYACLEGEFPTEESLDTFRKMLITSPSGGLVLSWTYLSFLAPHRFPLIDLHVAEWANNHLKLKSHFQDPGNIGKGAWSDDIAAAIEWSKWTIVAATHLDYLAPIEGALGLENLKTKNWTPRRVEMAIFQAQRNGVGASLPVPSHAMKRRERRT